MAVLIGHASIDERGRIAGGAAGDQSGKEVCTREYYSKGWNVCIRPKSTTTAAQMVKACREGTANNFIGYDQNQRNTAHIQAKKVGYAIRNIKTKCETDCSAFMTLCAIASGVKELEYTGNAPTTSTMRQAFSKTGKFEILTDKKYLESDTYLKAGDILVKEGSHTVMVLEDGIKAGKEPVKKETKKNIKIPTYKVGRNYTLTTELRVRTAPSTDAVEKGHSELTPGGKAKDKDKDGRLDKGTVVTCQGTKSVGGNVWMKIPSGWIVAYYKEKELVK